MTAARKAPDVRRDLAAEMSAAAVLKEHLRAIVGDDGMDAATIRDAVEGETNLLETIEATISQIGEDMAVVEGLKAASEKIGARSDRLAKRIELLRTMLANALQIVGQETHRIELERIAATMANRALSALTSGRLDTSAATVSIKRTPPKLDVADEAAIPTAYYRQPDPVLDKAGLTTALKARAAALAGLKATRKTTSMTQAEFDAALLLIDQEHPSVPGADLDGGGTTVQIRFS